MAIGIGAGQQSRIDCTRLAGQKADTWWLRRAVETRSELSLSARINHQLEEVGRLSPSVRASWLARMTDVSMASDGAIPFADNIEEAHRHGVRHLAEPGGSIRSAEVTAACADLGITLSHTGIRLFHH